MSIIVRFSDDEQKSIVSYFSAMPPIPEQFDNLGEVDSSDVRWHEYFELMSSYAPDLPSPE